MAIQFYMRGYNTVAHTGAPIGYVDWVVNDVPDSTATFVTTVNANYVPGEIANVTVNRIVQSKVDNFLKPEEGNVPLGPDSYWLHINAYDWLNQSPLTLPPNPQILVPQQITGLAIVRGTLTGTTPRDFSTLFWDEVNQQWTFAFNTNGDGTTVGALQNVNLGAMTMTGPLSVGNPPADTGLIRVANNQSDATGNTGAIKASNSTDTGDITLILADASNRVEVGSASDPVYVPSTIRVDTAVLHGFDPSSTSVAQTGFIRDQNNTVVVTARNFLATGDLNLLSTDTSDRILHGSSGLNKGHIFNTSTGATTSITAPSNNVSLPTATINVNTTTGFPVAGIIKVATGAGTQFVTYTGTSGGTQFTGCSGGVGTMLTGNSVTAYIFDDFQVSGTSQIQISPANLTYASGVSSPTISQLLNTANTVTGQPLTVQAQNAIGTTTTGGSLNLTGGTSTTTVVTAASNGASLPTGTINVASTTGFPTAGQITIVSSAGLQLVQYTGTTGTSFTGCTLGTGTISTGNNVTLSASAGNVNLQTGGYNRLSVSPTTVTSADPVVTFTNSFVSTTVAAGSNGAVLPQATINVVSTNGFPSSGVFSVASSQGAQIIAYTGVTATSFTGCTGGSNTLVAGTLSTGGAVVAAPLVQQSSISSASAKAQTLVVQSQNNTGATSTGGDLALTSGLGTTAAGNVLIQTGGVNQIIVSPTNVAAMSFPTNNNAKVIITCNLEVQGTTTTVDSTVVDIIGRVIHANWADPSVSPNVAVPSQITGYSIHRGNAAGVPRDGAAWIWTEGAQNSGADGYWRSVTIAGDGYGTDGYTVGVGGINIVGVMSNDFSVAADPNPNTGTLPGVGGLRTQNNTTSVSARNLSPSTTITGASDNTTLPQGTITVVSNTGFTSSGTLLILSDSGPQTVTYTGLGTNTFTGAVGGVGLLHTGQAVAQTNKSTTTTGTQTFPVGSLNVTSTVGFPASGTLRVATTNGIQTITYTGGGGAGTTFTGVSGGTGVANAGSSVSSLQIPGTNDLLLLGTDFGNKIIHGAPTFNTGHVFNTTNTQTPPAGIYDFQVNSISQLQISANDPDADGYVEVLTVGPTVIHPRFFQATQLNTGANNGFMLMLQAQAGQQQTGGNNNNNGGWLALASGKAGTGGGGTAGKDGYVDIITGSTLKMRVFPTTAVSASDNNSIWYFENLFRVDTAQTSPLFRQDDNTTTSATGQTYTIQAQNATGTTATGGALTLTSGTGTTAAGNVNISTGGTTRVIVHPTFTEFRDTAEALRITPVSAGTTQITYAATDTAAQINQTSTSTAAASMTIQSQVTTGNTLVGGNLNLIAGNSTGTTTLGGDGYFSSGTGTTSAGNIHIQTGGTDRIITHPTFTEYRDTAEALRITPVSAGTTQITYASTDTAAQINQTTTAGATGATMTVQAQNAATTGGALTLTSGTGTTAGNVNIQTGAATRVSVNPTFTSFSDTAEALRITPVSAGTTQITYAATVTSAQINQTQTASTPAAPMSHQAQVTTAASGVGGTFTLTAGNATGTTSTGGALNLASGSGTSTNGVINFQPGGTTQLTLSATGSTLQWALGVTSPTLNQANLTTNAGTGQALTVQAQNETGTTSTGGALVLTSGTGTTTAGNTNIQTGGVTRVAVNPTFTTFNDAAEAFRITPVSAGTTTLQFATGVTAATLFQADKTTNAGTGATLTVQAQNETGTTSTGGALTLTSGTGTTTAGNVNIQTGAVTRVAVNPTFTTFNDTTEAYRITPVSAGATTLQAINTATSVTYKQGDLTTASGTGATTTIQAQNETGTTSTGGALTLTSGTGTTTNGTVNLQVGGTTTASLVTNKFVFNKGRRRNVQTVTTTITVPDGYDYIAVDASSVYTISLPAAPTTGDTFEFKDFNGTSGTNTVTVSGNGKNIDGLTTALLNSNYTTLVVTYTGTQWSIS